jgi:hypothetical protein
VHRTAWLYTRGDASVSMTVDDESGADAVVLVVSGPGAAIATYNFPDQTALMQFAEEQEQRLRGEGFNLQAIAERRAGGDRRQAPRPDGVERRRRS